MIENLAFFKLFQKLDFWNTSSVTKNWILEQLSSESNLEGKDLYCEFLDFFGLPSRQFQKKLDLLKTQIESDLKCGFRFSHFGQSTYPSYFYRLEDPPLMFSYQGRACWEGKTCLSVIGSREPSSLSQDWMKTELFEFLKPESLNICVVSGGARGVDQLAHEVALLAHKPTVLFLPSGLRKPYPESDYADRLRAEIVSEGGAILSEYDSNLSMNKSLFSHRNRLIAAMNHSLLIVEAKRRSGTLMTAHYCLSLGKPIWVVPGHPLNKAFAGSVDLLSYGAQMVRNCEDLQIFFAVEQEGFASGSNAHIQKMKFS